MLCVIIALLLSNWCTIEISQYYDRKSRNQVTLWACSVPGPSAQGLSSLDEELRDLATDSDTDEDAGPSDKHGTSSSAEQPSVTVVEPDAIVLAGREQGALHSLHSHVSCAAALMSSSLSPRHPTRHVQGAELILMYAVHSLGHKNGDVVKSKWAVNMPNRFCDLQWVS